MGGLLFRLDQIGIAERFIDLGLIPSVAVLIERGFLVVVVAILAFTARFIARRLIVRVLHPVFRRTRVTWDDRIAERGVLLKLARIAPAIVLFFFGPILAPEIQWLGEAIRRITVAYIFGIAALVVDSVIDVFHDLYREQEFARKRPIKGLIQLTKVLLFIVAGILIITTILDQNPLGILSGLGALSAVLLLVFRDSILGFVSGVQLSANNMIEIGDWIEMPRYDADGDVIDITLQTIKVQNWDKTITTIPIYALVSDSFRNWRGMSESGGRRIKRSINIDMNSVRFATEQMLDRFRRYSRICDYIEERQSEIDEYNREHGIDLEDSVSGRRMTNLGVFRAYVQAYLRNHPLVRQDMTFLVRHLPPGPTGLPIEIYVFSADQRWAVYESIQADIIDHLLAVIPEFDLRVFQEPSGSELHDIARALESRQS